MKSIDVINNSTMSEKAKWEYNYKNNAVHYVADVADSQSGCIEIAKTNIEIAVKNTFGRPFSEGFRLFATKMNADKSTAFPKKI